MRPVERHEGNNTRHELSVVPGQTPFEATHLSLEIPDYNNVDVALRNID
jgi:hypothetical protein